MTGKEKDKIAVQRAEVILKVQTGQMTATEGAAVLKVSRKTFYEWQEKGLMAMLNALRNKDAGRPADEVDTVSNGLKKEVATLREENERLTMRMKARDILSEIDDTVNGKATSRSTNQKKENAKSRRNSKGSYDDEKEKFTKLLSVGSGNAPGL